MKKLLPFLLLLGLAAPAAAQDAPAPDHVEAPDGRRGHHHRRHRMMRRLFSQLDLSDEQRAQIRSIRQQARTEGRALRESGDRDAMFQHRRQTHERIRAVLTDAQRTRLGELRRGMENEHLQRRLARMTEHLQLNERQQQQVRGILRGAAQQRRALMQQARVDGTRPGEAMHQVFETAHAQIRSVLDSEQQARFDEVVERRRARHPHR